MKWPKGPWEIMNSPKQIDAERPRHVALTSHSGLRERPQWVALRGRSGLRFVSSRHGNASDLGTSLWQVALGGVSRDRNASDLSMSLWLDRYGMCVTATSRCRSGEVALMHCSSNDHLYHLFWAPNAPKCLQELHVVLQYLIRTHVCKMQPKHG